MTATTHQIVRRPSSTYSLDKKKAAGASLDAATVAALGAVTTANTVTEGLDLLSANVRSSHVVTETSIGKASHVDA